jgi:hypothetical protein
VATAGLKSRPILNPAIITFSYVAFLDGVESLVGNIVLGKEVGKSSDT